MWFRVGFSWNPGLIIGPIDVTLRLSGFCNVGTTTTWQSSQVTGMLPATWGDGTHIHAPVQQLGRGRGLSADLCESGRVSFLFPGHWGLAEAFS